VITAGLPGAAEHRAALNALGYLALNVSSGPLCGWP
jgi:hypothetical protein